MNQGYDNLIVKKSAEIEIGRFNNSDEYIITHKTFGNRILINKNTFDLISLIDGKTKLVDLISKFNTANSSKLDLDTAYALLYEKLGKQGVIINENITLKKQDTASYLSLSFNLVNEKALNFFIKLIAPFIIFKHFYKILFFSLLMVVFTVFSNFSKITKDIENTSLSNWIIYFLISGGILFLHEFGHASACKKLGAKPGNIGFGFYLLSPVMFADVSDIWRLDSRQRNYVNFAGLYMEIIIGLLLSIIYLFFLQDTTILIICSIILLSFTVNLNPFLRYDGYWILSDTINTPNLRKVSMEKFKYFINSIFRKEKVIFTGKDIFLVVYAFISVVFIFIFLAFILIKDPNALLSFPVDIYLYLEAVLKSEAPFLLSGLTQFILPFLFYFILIKFITNLIQRRVRHRHPYG